MKLPIGRRLVISVALCANAASAAPNDLALVSVEQGPRRIDARLLPPDATQRLTLADGSVLFGQITSLDDDHIVFQTIGD